MLNIVSQTLPLKFDLLLKNLTLVIVYELWETGLSYFTSVFLVTRPFAPYYNFRLNDLDIELWMTFTKCCYFNLVASRQTSLSSDISCFCLLSALFFAITLNCKTLYKIYVTSHINEVVTLINAKYSFSDFALALGIMSHKHILLCPWNGIRGHLSTCICFWGTCTCV